MTGWLLLEAELPIIGVVVFLALRVDSDSEVLLELPFRPPKSGGLPSPLACRASISYRLDISSCLLTGM